MSEEKKGIKELVEFLEAAGAVIQVAKKVGEDGFGKDDFALAFQELFAKYPTIVKGIEGLKEAIAEAKDIDGAEAVVLVKEIVEEIEKIEAV